MVLTASAHDPKEASICRSTEATRLVRHGILDNFATPSSVVCTTSWKPMVMYKQDVLDS